MTAKKWKTKKKTRKIANFVIYHRFQWQYFINMNMYLYNEHSIDQRNCRNDLLNELDF